MSEESPNFWQKVGAIAQSMKKITNEPFKGLRCAKSLENEPDCVYCSQIVPTMQTFVVESTQDTIFIPELTCESKKCIYYAECTECKLGYVGSTAQMFKSRLATYKSKIRRGKRGTRLDNHFREAHADAEDRLKIFRIFPIRNYERHSANQLKCHERFWTETLRTHERHGGLNKRNENGKCSCADFKLEQAQLAGVMPQLPLTE